MKQNFDRKIYTAGLLFSDLGFLIWNTPKIMNVTTAVNGCTYCAWFHAKQALASGISEEEIQNMMNLQFHADAEEFELMALLYAQHYAETNRNPDAEMKQKLMDYYGDKMANDVILVIRMVFLGNLYGNTWDAVLSRIKGMPAKGSNILFELIFFLINFWFMFPLMWLMKKNQ